MPREDLAARKALLLARSTLHRLELARDVELLRGSLHWRNVISSAATSAPWRPLVMGALLLVAGRGRIAGALALATRAIGLVKLFRGIRAGRKRVR